MPSPLEEISKLQQQIETLKDAAITELRNRKAALEAELKSVDGEIERLTGKQPRQRRVRYGTPEAAGAAPTQMKRPDLQELKALLAAAPNKTISLRKEGYDVRNVRVLAQANPHLLRMGGKGPWPEVTLLK